MAIFEVNTETGGYTADVATRTITLGGLNNIRLDQLVEVTNTTKGIPIYHYKDFNDATTSITSNVISLSAMNASTMSNSDAYRILIDYPDKLIPNRVDNIQVGGHAETQQVVVANTVNTYTSQDNIGGITIIPSITRYSGATVELKDVSIWSGDNQKFDGTIDFWKVIPTVGTYTDNQTQIIQGDNESWLGCISFFMQDFVSNNNTVMRTSISGDSILLQSDSTSQDIYFTITVDGNAPIYANANNLFIKFSYLQF